MNLKLLAIIDRGVRKDERLHISVLANANLTYYAVFATRYQNGGIVAIPEQAYWFSDQPVKAGDHVILYTKSGTDSTSARKDGFTNHFFYWGLSMPLWTDPVSCAVLISIDDWETFPRSH